MEGYISMLNVLECDIIVAAAGPMYERALELAKERTSLKVINALNADTILDKSSGNKSFPFDKNFNDICRDPCVIVHTSGTTGSPFSDLPWPIYICY